MDDFDGFTPVLSEKVISYFKSEMHRHKWNYDSFLEEKFCNNGLKVRAYRDEHAKTYFQKLIEPIGGQYDLFKKLAMATWKDKNGQVFRTIKGYFIPRGYWDYVKEQSIKEN